ncbi:sialidase family protein [Streptomyces sp. NPDC093252]|uniref:sialidase family protein n=1 Tax=Streptomyces sp. NPDC093252 TaxID=3154980 RepID=UPI00341BAE7D
MPRGLHAPLRTVLVTVVASLVAAVTPATTGTASESGPTGAVPSGAVPSDESGPSGAGSSRSGRPAAGDFQQSVLFKASQDPGYACFRIPAIVRTTRGTLLAFAEGRVLNCGDATDIDLVVKRSTDGGRTWGPLQVVSEGNGDTHGNPSPLVDRETGRILLVQTRNPGRTDSASCEIPCPRTPHLQYSDDDGRTWSAPRDLSAQVQPAHWNSWYATGPVHGVQIDAGAHAGRLVLGVNAETWDGQRVTANDAALIISDDGGTTWRVGATDSWPIAADGTFGQKPSEVTVEAQADGSLLISAREQDGTDLGHRSQAVSTSGGSSFDTPFQKVPDLYAPQVQGALLRLGDRMLLACPADPDRRRTMMVRSSYDGGRTWDSVDRGTVVSRDWAGYSDLADLGSSTVGLLYEGGAVDARDEIRFARFTEDWLAPRRGPDPTTADLAPSAPPAAVLGGAATTPGVRGNALALDGVDDAVRLPYDARLPLGAKDFTASLWFRYTATTGEQPMLWMGGTGVNQPQVWLRGEPANDRVRALITTRTGATAWHSASLSASGARNDGVWHHLALRRGGGELTLFLDGEQVTTTDVLGSVSRNSPFGVHIGQRMDSRAYFTGALDDVRVYDKALTDGELTALRLTGVAPYATPVLHLPMDRIIAGG